MKIHKTLMVFLLALLISVPALAAKPPTNIFLVGGPIPINSGSDTQFFSCNVLNHRETVIFDFSMKLCGVEGDGTLHCAAPVTVTLGNGTALEEKTGEDVFNGSTMMICNIDYEGRSGDVTGTACMSDASVGQACVPLQEVESGLITVKPL